MSNLLKCSLLLVGLTILSAVIAPEARAVSFENKCITVCDGTNESCDRSCIAGGVSTSCKYWLQGVVGGTSNDHDADGVANSNDNCLCKANSGQANCDGDSAGDACDPATHKWVLVSDTGPCDWDGDQHVWGSSVEVYFQRKYKDVCNNNAVCFDRYVRSSGSCYLEYNEYQCCTSGHPDQWCDNLLGCSGPACPF